MKYTKIKTENQYSEYCEMHERLVFANYSLNKSEIEVLEILIDEYENRTVDFSDKIDSVQTISYLIEENGITKSQLAKELGVSRQLITDILNYRRNISKMMINKLAKRFKMQSTAFSRPYNLLATTKQTA